MTEDIDMPCARMECVSLPGPALRLATCCDSSGILAVWNKHDVYVYHLHNLSEPASHFVSDFCIRQVLLSPTYAACVDSNGAVHILTLKLKSHSIKQMCIPFKPTAQEILACYSLDEDIVISLTQIEGLTLSVHKLNQDFKMIKKYVLSLSNVKSDFRNTIMKCLKCKIDSAIKKFFKHEINSEEAIIVVFSPDGLTVYGVCVHLKESKISDVVKIFKCPSKIADFHIKAKTNQFKIVVGLKQGTVICLECEEDVRAKIIHLNSIIHRFLPLNEDIILYTDGINVWITNLSRKERNYKKLFVSQAKDFIQINDKIICITFSNLIYSFIIDSDTLLQKVDQENDGFICIPKDLSTCKEVVADIVKEVEKNNEVLKKIKSENNLMLAVALSKNISILNQHIKISAYTFEFYEEVTKIYNSITLTQSLCKYFEGDTRLLLVSLHISTHLQHKVIEMCSCLSNNLQLHIETSSMDDTQATTVTLGDKNLDSLNILIPVVMPKTKPKIKIKVKIVSPVSGPIDKGQIFWTVLYSTSRELNAENFIQIEDNYKRTKIMQSCEDIVTDIAIKNHGSLYNLKLKNEEMKNKKWSCYLRMPKDFQTKLSDKDLYSTTLSPRISEYLSKKLGSNELCSGVRPVYVTVCNRKVQLSLSTDEGSAVLTLSGEAELVCELREYVSSLLHRESQASQLLPHSHYTRVEDVQRRVRHLLASADTTRADLLRAAEHLHRHTLATLPSS